MSHNRIIVHVARTTAYAVKTVRRSAWTPPSLRDPKKLLRSGFETINDTTYIRLERWNRRRRAFVLEALVLPSSPILRILKGGISEKGIL